ISKNGIEVDKEKVDVIAKLPHPTTVKVPHGLPTLQTTMRRISLLREFHLSKRTNSSKMRSFTFGTTNFGSKSVRIKSSGGVFTAKKPLTFSRLATIDPPRDIMARTTQPRRFGSPRAIISDRGTHFCNDQFTKVMLKYGVRVAEQWRIVGV
nr:reverse transcriptase domain-containing protein [Tanacetum cinerariifolium]